MKKCDIDLIVTDIDLIVTIYELTMSEYMKGVSTVLIFLVDVRPFVVPYSP